MSTVVLSVITPNIIFLNVVASFCEWPPSVINQEERVVFTINYFFHFAQKLLIFNYPKGQFNKTLFVQLILIRKGFLLVSIYLISAETSVAI
jgi:hypothetical protein